MLLSVHAVAWPCRMSSSTSSEQALYCVLLTDVACSQTLRPHVCDSKRAGMLRPEPDDAHALWTGHARTSQRLKNDVESIARSG